MSKIIKILELSDRGGSQREISRATHTSLRTVNQTLRAAKAANVGAMDFVGKDEAEARLVLFGAPGRESGYRPPDYATVDKELRKDGVNLSLLWDEYVRDCAGENRKPYQYAQYCRLYAAWRKSTGGSRPTMRMAHTPGRVAEVDWAGARAPYVNRTTGEVVRAWVFVGCLPYSQELSGPLASIGSFDMGWLGFTLAGIFAVIAVVVVVRARRTKK